MNRTKHVLPYKQYITPSFIFNDAVSRRVEKERRQNQNLQAKCHEFSTAYGRQLALGALEPFAQAVRAHIAEESKPHAKLKGRPQSFTQFVLAIPSERPDRSDIVDAIVLLTLQSVIDGLSRERSLVAVADTIGTLLDEYCRDGEVWPAQARVLVGLKCIEMLEQSVPDLVCTKLMSKPGQGRRKTEYHLCPTDKTLALIADSPEKVGWAHPLFVPTLTLPDAYDAMEDAPLVSRVLNALQATPWMINQRVYDVARSLEVGVSKESRVTGKEARAASTMRLAKDYIEANCFYFPMHLDFRGRIYARSPHLSVQADDLAAALLTFPQTEGKPLGTDGLYWLRCHGANVFGHGVDKASLDGRQSWGLFGDDAGSAYSVHAVADNPFEPNTLKWWQGSDKPWQFLAWCFEYSAALRHPDGPTNFVSTLPIAIDGSCNGLQHMSAVMRDAVGGNLVNLGAAEENEAPQDVYSAIAEAVKHRMKLEQDSTKKPYADAWLSWPKGLSRKAAKKIVMVIPYAATRYGATDGLIDYLDEESTCPWNDYEKRERAAYFTSLVFEAVKELVPSSLLLREWLKQVSDELSKVNRPIEWRVPGTGWPVVQENYKYTMKTVQAQYSNDPQAQKKRRSLNLRIDSTTQLCPRQQRSAISPNFIHSLDAAHLVLTMNALLDHGVSRFGCVHDSYVTLAADMGLLSELTRRTFIELHAGNIMESFLETSCAHLPEEVTARLRGSMPKQRGLVLEQVAESPYLFS